MTCLLQFVVISVLHVGINILAYAYREDTFPPNVRHCAPFH